jgi:hypothetical protein
LTTKNLRDRVKELRRVPASELRAHSDNWRKHPQTQKDVMRGVLDEVGFADAVLAYEAGDGVLTLVDGHLRADMAGMDTIPVLVLDITDAEAKQLLLTLDPLGAMARSDKDALGELLTAVSFDAPAVDDMLEALMNNETMPMPDWSNIEGPTQESIDSRQGEMETAFENQQQGNDDKLVEVVCPDCMKPFHVHVRDLLNDTKS